MERIRISRHGLAKGGDYRKQRPPSPDELAMASWSIWETRATSFCIRSGVVLSQLQAAAYVASIESRPLNCGEFFFTTLFL